MIFLCMCEVNLKPDLLRAELCIHTNSRIWTVVVQVRAWNKTSLKGLLFLGDKIILLWKVAIRTGNTFPVLLLVWLIIKCFFFLIVSIILFFFFPLCGRQSLCNFWSYFPCLKFHPFFFFLWSSSVLFYGLLSRQLSSAGKWLHWIII